MASSPSLTALDLSSNGSTCRRRNAVGRKVRDDDPEVLGTARASEADAESRHAEEKARLEAANAARAAELPDVSCE